MLNFSINRGSGTWHIWIVHSSSDIRWEFKWSIGCAHAFHWDISSFLVCSVDRARIIYNHYYKFLMGSGLGTVVTKFCSMPGCCQWLIYFIFIFDKSLSQLKSGFWWVFFCLVLCVALGVFLSPCLTSDYTLNPSGFYLCSVMFRVWYSAPDAP